MLSKLNYVMLLIQNVFTMEPVLFMLFNVHLKLKLCYLYERLLFERVSFKVHIFEQKFNNKVHIFEQSSSNVNKVH